MSLTAYAVPSGENIIQLFVSFSHGSVQIFGIFCWSCEATIEVSDEGIQPSIGLPDAFEAHFLDKPVLRKYATKLRNTGRGGTPIIAPENTVLIAAKR